MSDSPEIETDTDNETFADCYVNGSPTASIDVGSSNEEVRVRVFDPDNPEDCVADHRFDIPNNDK